ncbi:MAG TPA: MXAN_5187 C-terminal domain-containing protein, partial [Polyangiaceae bacterium]
VVARPPAAAASAPTLLSEDRVRTLHAELVAARRKLNQGDNVSMDSLAKSLRETEKKLRAQHAGRSVDFQIVVKDGKPVVKPVVRK